MNKSPRDFDDRRWANACTKKKKKCGRNDWTGNRKKIPHSFVFHLFLFMIFAALLVRVCCCRKRILFGSCVGIFCFVVKKAAKKKISLNFVWNLLQWITREGKSDIILVSSILIHGDFCPATNSWIFFFFWFQQNSAKKNKQLYSLSLSALNITSLTAYFQWNRFECAKYTPTK